MYGLVLLVLNFFKRKLLMNRLIPVSLQDNNDWGVIPFVGFFLGFCSFLDIGIGYKSEHDFFLSVLIVLMLTLWLIGTILYVYIAEWRKNLPEE